MDRTWILVAALAAPLALQTAACSQNDPIDPMTQKSGSVESKNCGTEATRMQNVVNNAPEGRQDRTQEATLYVNEALQQAKAGNQAGCWSQLGKAQAILP